MSGQSVPRFRFLYAAPGGFFKLDRTRKNMVMFLERPRNSGSDRAGISYGAYVNLIKRTLMEKWDLLTDAFLRRTDGKNFEVHRVDIVVEKHGSDYHPARIRIRSANALLSFVINVALTERGMERAENEFHLLQEMNRLPGPHYVPRTYFFTDSRLVTEGGDSRDVAMFLGDWFEGYHEFHLTQGESESNPATVLWDYDQGHRLLAEEESREISRQAAFILTHYFDVETCKEIFPWHHASGDFIVAPKAPILDVRLVTVRQFDARIQVGSTSREASVEALLAFLANMTIRMRLDRLDGVGDIAWAGKHRLLGTVHGFMDALKQKVHVGMCDRDLLHAFERQSRRITPSDLAMIFGDIVESYDANAPDIPVIQEHLVDHIYEVYSTLQASPGNDLSSVSGSV